MKTKILKFYILSFIILIAASYVAKEDSACAALTKEDKVGAAAYNELGVQAIQDGQIDAAVSYLEEAAALDPGNGIIKKNLSAAYYKKGEAEYIKHDLSAAKKHLKVSLENDPDNINALGLMGELHYLSQDMDEAKRLWEKILKLDPDYPYADGLKEKLKKLEKEARVEKKFRSTTSDKFDIRYSKEATRLSYDIRHYLQEAYRLVGQDFNYQPKRKITVLIYEKGDFESVGDWREGTLGIYDGKIRLPLINADITTNEIKGIAWHEYTHAIIHDLAKGNCPVWLNEGLAKYEEFRYAHKDFSLLKGTVKKGGLILLKDLNSAFSTAADEIQLELAYEQAYTLANYLIKRYSRYKIRKVLERLGNNETIDLAFRKELNITMAEFERRWLKDLKAGKLY